MSRGLEVCGFYCVWSEAGRQGLLSVTKHREILPPPPFPVCFNQGLQSCRLNLRHFKLKETFGVSYFQSKPLVLQLRPIESRKAK